MPESPDRIELLSNEIEANTLYFHLEPARLTRNALDATVLQTLSLWQGRDERCFRTHKKLSEQLGCAGASTIGESLGRLEALGLVEIDRTGIKNHRKYDRKLNFTVPKDIRKSLCHNNSSKGAIRFSVKDAKKPLNICCAVILNNLRESLKKDTLAEKDETGQLYARLSPSWLADYFGGCFHRATIQRSIATLKKFNRIVEHPEKSNLYRLHDAAESTNANPAMSVAKPDSTAANPVMGVANPVSDDANPAIYINDNEMNKANTKENTQQNTPLRGGAVLCLLPEDQNVHGTTEVQSDSISAFGEDRDCLDEKWKQNNDLEQQYFDALDRSEFESFMSEVSSLAIFYLNQVSIEQVQAIQKGVSAHRLLLKVAASWKNLQMDLETHPPKHPIDELTPFAQVAVVHAILMSKEASYLNYKMANGKYAHYIREIFLDFVRREIAHDESERVNAENLVYEQWNESRTEAYNTLGVLVADSTLPARRKTELFFRGVQILNKVGVFYQGQVHDAKIKLFQSKHRLHAEQFFEANPNFSVHDVLGLLHRCAFAAQEPIDGYDELFHVKRGINGASLFKFADQIVAQLELQATYPVVAPVSSPDRELSFK